MGTCNFSQEESDRIYAIDIEDEFIYDDIRESVGIEIENSLNKNKQLRGSFKADDDYFDTGYPVSRNFPSRLIGVIDFNEYWASFDCEVDIRINVIITSGYYSGANLDYVTEITLNGTDISFDLDTELLDPVEFGYFDTKVSDRQIEWVQNWINSNRGRAISKVQKVFADYSTPLITAARFSNGAALYEIAAA